jgi:hypothetical protein
LLNEGRNEGNENAGNSKYYILYFLNDTNQLFAGDYTASVQNVDFSR